MNYADLVNEAIRQVDRSDKVSKKDLNRMVEYVTRGVYTERFFKALIARLAKDIEVSIEGERYAK